MTRVREWLRTPDARWLIVIFLIAMVLRLALVGWAHPSPRDGRYDDSVWYDTAAQRLAEGKGYVFDPTVWRAPNGSLIYPNETGLTPTALWPPGYPLTLAPLYKVTGNSLWAARLFNVLCGSATAALVFLLAKKLFGRRPGIFAGLTMAIFPGPILFTTLLLSETYFGFLLALQLALYVYFVFDREKPNLPLIVGLGALTAFTGYTRGEFMAYGAVFAVLMIFHFRRRALVPLAALALGAAIVITPWTVRNYVHFNQVITGTTGSGRVAYQGHNSQSSGGPSLEAFWQLEARYQGQSRKQIELGENEDGSRLARKWAESHKLEELKLVPRRMYMLFRSDESGITWMQSNKWWTLPYGPEGADRLIRISSAFFFGVIALALAGWPLWWKTRDTKRLAVFGIVPFYMIVFGVVFIGDPRYHYALYIPLSIFSAPALSVIWGATAAQWREVFRERTFGSLLRTFGTPSP